jgi:hypothetical protein
MLVKQAWPLMLVAGRRRSATDLLPTASTPFTTSIQLILHWPIPPDRVVSVIRCTVGLFRRQYAFFL